jgi:hypothetical protein
MPQTIFTDREAERRRKEIRAWLGERQLGVLTDAPSVTPEQQPYTFENGTPYVPRAKCEDPLILDRGFDGPA